MAAVVEEEGSQSSGSSPDLDHPSMTAKGIKHLCTELLEINKASAQDFRSNLYGSYRSFLRLFGEAGDLEQDVGQLKRHVIAHRELLLQLASRDDSMLPPLPVEVEEEQDDEIEMDANWEWEDALDILVSEHRIDQALELLELQTQALQRMQQQADGHPARPRLIASAMSALSASKARVADRLACLADNPRTPRPELLAALSGLCRLGDAHAQRANHLLFKSYRSNPSVVVRGRHADHQRINYNYIKELARAVFSSILQASRSLAMLHGHPSSYTSELARWAREEMEDLSVAFCEYVKSVSLPLPQPQGGESMSVSASLALALDAANCAFSYCSLLRPLGVVSEQDLMELMVPCLEEVLATYGSHLKEVVRLFVASDSCVLGRFLLSGMLRSAAAAALQTEQCLLTTSGRKFVTLIQEAVEDVSPLLNLGMKSSAVRLLAELFREYMHSIVEVVVPVPAGNEGALDSDEQQQQQLSVLINCTTLVSLFPVIARGIFEQSNEASRLSAAGFSTQGEVGSLILSIKEAAGQVWTRFCQQFIRDTMSTSSRQTRPTASLGEGISPQGMMPSHSFQVLFLRVRQLSNLYGAILSGKDGTMKKLLRELMQAMIFWLSNNLDCSWIHQAQSECVPKDMLFDQIQLDIHFLLEFAQLGGFSSDNITSSAWGLLRKAQEKLSHGIMNSGKEGWATDAAKHAVQVLMGTQDHISGSQPEEEASVEIEDAVMADQDTMLESWSNDGHGSSSVDETGACKSSTDEFISVEEEEEDGDSGNGNHKLRLKDIAVAVDDCGGGDTDSQVARVAVALSDDACCLSGCGSGGSSSPEPEEMSAELMSTSAQAGSSSRRRQPANATTTRGDKQQQQGSRKKRSSRPRWK